MHKATATPPLLIAEQLAKHYTVKRGSFSTATVKAVDGVDLKIMPGQALGIVGESGSGKSTIARLLLRLTEPTAGRIVFDGEDITTIEGEALRRLRREMQIVFQNPHSALNGRHTIFDAIAEPLIVQDGLRGQPLIDRVKRLMDLVRLPQMFVYRYPHELSGGQKQRVCIARAVALQPRLLVLDEPTSALDVSVQAQILAFLRDLQTELNLTYLFISHNLAVVRYLCDRVAVMYLGRVLEEGATEAVFSAPQHPYTQALMAAVPRLEAGTKLGLLQGDIPTATRMPTGCRFHTRCSEVIGARCKTEIPALTPISDDHLCACIARNTAPAAQLR